MFRRSALEDCNFMASASYPHARDLVEEFPDIAVFLIVTTCDYQNIVETLTHARDRRSRRKASSTGTDYQALESALATSPVDSQQSVSPPNIQRFRPRTPQNSRSALPPSPAPTPSTGKSPLLKEHLEYVCILDGPPDGQIQEHPLSMRKTPMRHNLIREDIFKTRLWSSCRVESVPNAPISLECPGTSTGFLLSSHRVILTWRRSDSHKTHETMFYLVPDEIDVDILLGYLDSGEGFFPTELQTPHPQWPRREPVPPAVYPPAADSPLDRRVTPSYHRSSVLSYGSNITSHVPPAFQEILSRDRGPVSAHHSPTPTQIHQSRPPSSGDPHVRGQNSTGTPSPISNIHQQSILVDEIRVEFKWDNDWVIVKLDLNVTGEVFFNVVENKYQRRYQKILDRSTHTILFTTERRAESAAKYSLSLEETDLGDDWPYAVVWMKEHVKTDPPRLYAFIQHDAG